MAAALKDRLAASVLDVLRAPSTPLEELLEPWRVAACLNCEEGTKLFAGRVCGWFVAEAKRVQTRLSLHTKLSSGAVLAGAAGPSAPGPAGLPALGSGAAAGVDTGLPRLGTGAGAGTHVEPPAPTPSTSPPLSSTRGGDAGGHGDDDDDDDGDDDDDDDDMDPFLDAVHEVLVRASTFIHNIMAESMRSGAPVPNKARSAVVFQLHSVCAKHTSTMLDAYSKHLDLDNLATRLLLSPPPNGSPNAVSGSGTGTGASAGAGAGASAGGGGRAGADAARDSRSPSSAQDTQQLMASVNVVASKVAFVCQLVERYLRCVTVSLLLGREDQDSQMRCELTRKMQEFINGYLLLERSFLEWSFAKAMQTSRPLDVEDGITALSWVDDGMFVLKQSVSRSVLSLSQLATGSTLNNVVSLLDGTAGDALKACVRAAGEFRLADTGSRHVGGPGSANGGILARAGSIDEADDELSFVFADALLDTAKMSAHAVHSVNTAAVAVRFTQMLHDGCVELFVLQLLGHVAQVLLFVC